MSGGEVRVLGPVAVVESGGALSLPAKHARLLAALVCADGRALGVDELVDAVWDGSAPASARKLVQVYISQLRKKLPTGCAISTRGSAYSIELAPDALDGARFERMVNEARDTGSASNAALALSLADRALALWRGRAYGDLAYEEFARAESERLEELRLIALEERISALLELGRQNDALGEALALADEEPFRERSHELVILSLYRGGRQADALAHYAAFRARLADELGLEPGKRLRQLQRRILQQDPELAISGGVGSIPPALPLSSTPLVGRARELAELAALLTRGDDRLIVLTGAGGSGKTRLALEVARRAADSYANGALFVELAPLRDPALVVPTIAHEVGLAVGSGDDVLALLAAALETKELLLVLDNFEHVRDAATSLPLLVARAPRLTLLVTSRTVLHISGERVFPVAPLPEDDALDLFARRARLLDPELALSEENEADVREVCRRVDCLPLAIELAAARVRTLTPSALRSRLEKRLGLLTGGPRDLPARQRTLRETIEWSVDLLDDGSRQALARLSVFPAGASLEAAEQVCDADLDTFSTLVDHHLVQRSVWRGSPRLSLMETVHEYAFALLAGSGDDFERTRRRHADWCLAFVGQAEPNLSGDKQAEWLDELEAKHDSLRAALDYLDEVGDTDAQLRLTVLLSRFWYVRGFPAEGRRRLERVLDKVTDQPPLERRRAYTSAASLALLQGDYPAATAFAERALEAARDASEPRFLANAYSNLGAIRLAGGDLAGAEDALEEAVRLARDAGDERIAALALNNLGDYALTLGDYERAGPLFEESLALLRAREDTANIARSLFNNGAVDLMQGRIAVAETRFRESLTLARQSGDREDIAWSLLGLAAVEVETGNGQHGALLLGAARRVLSEMSAAFKPFERQLEERTEERSLARNGHEEHRAAVARGLALSLDEALKLVLDPRDSAD